MTKKEINTAFKKSGMKKTFVADKLGITPEYLSKIIAGDRKAESKRKELEMFLTKQLKKAA